MRGLPAVRDLLIQVVCGMNPSHTFFVASDQPKPGPPQLKRRYAWPWFVVFAVVLWIVLGILWLSREAKRIRRERDLNAPVRIGRGG